MAETDRDDWWRGAIIYQIYPRSFLDTTGNGVGDLCGIAERLDYVAELGVDAVWISPFVKSPMLDFGYDVSDYLDVDPLFGSLEDFRHLLEEAHARGLRVVMDQVFSHTSDKHPWFLESREGRGNPKADWYVWADAKPDGSPPNNWISVFGGSAWQWEPRRGQYFLHNFLRQQPDLNFHCAEVQGAVLDVARYWLDMGVDGFRLDVCAFYTHDAKLRDNPPNPAALRGSHFHFNPYGLQLHTHDIAQPENLRFLERLRALCDEYDGRMLLGELHETESALVHQEYTGPGRLQLAYGYWLLGADEIDAGLIRRTAEAQGFAEGDGWTAWALDNHDFTRSVTRLGFGDQPSGATVALAALSCLRGAMCLYQGSELGLPQANVPFEKLIDPYGREFFPAFSGRDGSRTPMPWRQEGPFNGFSVVEPWLPIPEEHRALAVDAQCALPGSTLNRLKRFLNWRREQPALRRGAMSFLETEPGVLGFQRILDGQAITCLFNFRAEEAICDLPARLVGEAMDGHGFGAVFDGERLHIPGHGAYFGAAS